MDTGQKQEISEFDMKNNYLSKQYAESINDVNAKQIKEDMYKEVFSQMIQCT